MKNRTLILHGLAIFSTILFVILQLYDPSIVSDHLESKTYDLRLYIKSLIKDYPSPENILIVTVDEKSISEIGRWQWSRKTQAKLLEKVLQGKPKAVGIDILYSEPQDDEADGILADVLSTTDNIVLATGFLTELQGRQKQDLEYLWDHAFLAVQSTDELPWKDFLVKPENVLAPIVKLADNSILGSVLSPHDRDGVLRWEILYLYFDEEYYASMPLQVARLYMGVPMEDMVLQGGTGVQLGEDRLVKTDLNGRVLVNYLGSDGLFTYISASDVLLDRVKPDIFKDKAILIGTSAVATYDQKVTPMSSNMPGVEKNATVIENIINDRFIKKSPGLFEIIITIITGLLLTTLLQRLNALRGTLLSASLIAFYIIICFYALIHNDLWINMTYPSMNLFLIFSIQITTQYFFEERKARQMRAMFSSYVSPKVVEALIANPELAKLGGQKKEVTVLFSDIAGFTSLSENMEPEEVVSRLNEYFKAMTDIIFRWEGTFDKIVGDEIMAFWGAPIDQDNHPELATRCALDMISTLRKLQAQWISEGKPIIDIGVGLNTGPVLVGNIGAEDKKMDYTIIGDHVNAGARVEALTRSFKAKILMTEFTQVHIQPLIDSGSFGHIELPYRGSTKVKGKEKELDIYELLDTEYVEPDKEQPDDKESDTEKNASK